MKLSKEQQKKIEKDVMKYVKSFQVKDEQGNITSTGLEVNHLTLLAFYRQTFFLALSTDNERLYAKQFFKGQLPFKEFLEQRQKDPMGILPDIEDFEELYDRTYQRKTERRTS